MVKYGMFNFMHIIRDYRFDCLPGFTCWAPTKSNLVDSTISFIPRYLLIMLSHLMSKANWCCLCMAYSIRVMERGPRIRGHGEAAW